MLDAATNTNLYSFSGNSALEAGNHSNDVMIGVASRHHPCRAEVEAFIKKGFHKAHAAQLQSIMPTLLYARNSKMKAAMGIRSANQTTFVEQYFAKSLQETLAEQGIVTECDKVVEIGNLHSTSARFTQQLLLCSALALSLSGKEYIVFTGIPKVTRIFEQFNIPLTSICPAKESAVRHGPDQWGTYYQDAPQVMVLSIQETLHAINHCPSLTKLRKSLTCSTYIIHQHLKENLA